MKSKHIYLDEFGWVVKLYCDVSESDTDTIVNYMIDCGYSMPVTYEAYDFVSNIDINTGATITSDRYKESVIIISQTTTPAEFFNTMIHELNHLSDSIAKVFKIKCNGEEISYMIGNIGIKMFPFVEQYLCCKII